MKFLLTALNAKYIHSNPALYSLRAFVSEELQASVEIAEYTINNRMEDILSDIYLRKPDVLAFSCYIWNWRQIQDLLLEIPKLMKNVPIWLGGPEVSFDALDILKKYPMVTGIMIGEGEETFRKLLTYYLNSEGNGNEQETQKQEIQEKRLTLQDISGLALPTGMTENQSLTDLNTLPFLYRDLSEFQNKIIYYESSRGCPYRCSYCLSSIDKTVRFRDMELVKKELWHFLNQRAAQVKFIDRTFNCNHEHAMEIWKFLLENDNGITNFHFEIAADILREEELEILGKLRPGQVQLEIGVQSTNPKTLKEINRVMNIDRLRQIVAAIRKSNNIHQHLDLIAGLPYEDYESFGKSFNDVYEMKPQQLQLGFLKVLKGSLLFDKAKDYGIHYLEQPPYEVLFTKWLSYEDVLKLKRVEEMVELYYNSNQFTYTIRELEKSFASPFSMYEELAEFYLEKGYFTNSPKRSYRYEILLAFAARKEPEKEELYKELLTFDMYLRENLKSRPAFARDLTEWKQEIRKFFQNGKNDKSTHLEAFYYPVQEEGELKKREEPEWLLFDYEQRNPLTFEANVMCLTPHSS